MHHNKYPMPDRIREPVTASDRGPVPCRRTRSRPGRSSSRSRQHRGQPVLQVAEAEPPSPPRSSKSSARKTCRSRRPKEAGRHSCCLQQHPSRSQRLFRYLAALFLIKLCSFRDSAAAFRITACERRFRRWLHCIAPVRPGPS